MDDQALQAIRSGDVDAYVELIESRAAVVAHSLPRPDGSPWAPEDVEDLVSSFYGSAAYEHAVLNARDDDSLRALVFTGLANLVRADLRRTERGRLHRRVRELLASEGFVERPTKYWRRVDDPESASAATESDLLEATWSVDVRLVKWRADAQRHSPFAEKTSFIDLLEAIYDLAAGALHIDVLVDVLSRRLGVGPVSAIEELDLVEERFVAASDPGPAEHLLDQEGWLEAAGAAAELWDQLSRRERELLPHLAASARDAADAVGGGKSAVNEAMKRLKEKIRTVLEDSSDEDRSRIVGEMVALTSGAVDS
jgi:hypothetical protein